MRFLNLIPERGPSLPLPTDLAQANLAFAALAETPAAEALTAALAHDMGRALLEGAFDGSPYLARAAEKTPQAFIDCLNIGPDAAFAQIITTLESVASASSQLAAMATLREAKLGGALIIGLADLAGIWTLEQVTGGVSERAWRLATLLAINLALNRLNVANGIEIKRASPHEWPEPFHEGTTCRQITCDRPCLSLIHI